MHSHSGAVPQGTERFYAELTGPKNITWLEEFGQEDFYFRPPAVDAALEAVRGVVL